MTKTQKNCFPVVRLYLEALAWHTSKAFPLGETRAPCRPLTPHNQVKLITIDLHRIQYGGCQLLPFNISCIPKLEWRARFLLLPSSSSIPFSERLSKLPEDSAAFYCTGIIRFFWSSLVWFTIIFVISVDCDYLNHVPLRFWGIRLEIVWNDGIQPVIKLLTLLKL